MEEALIEEFSLNVSKQDAIVTFQVYLELCEVKKYYNVEYSYNTVLQKYVITANKIKHGSTGAFIPCTIYEELNFLKLHKIFCAVPNIVIYLVIVHPDSTCVYYQIAEGLLEPNETDSKTKHSRHNKRERLDNDLRKNRKLLEQSALYGIPVTIRTENNAENRSS